MDIIRKRAPRHVGLLLLLLLACYTRASRPPSAAPTSKDAVPSPPPSVKQSSLPTLPSPTARPSSTPTHPSSRPTVRPTETPSAAPTMLTYDQLVFEIDNVALSLFSLPLTLLSVRMALDTALNVNASGATVGVPVASAGPTSPTHRALSGLSDKDSQSLPVFTPVQSLRLRRHLSGPGPALSPSRAPSHAPTPVPASSGVTISTCITTPNDNSDAKTSQIISDTNAATLQALFKQNSQLFLSKFIASVTEYDKTPENVKQFASASISPNSVYVVSLMPTAPPTPLPAPTPLPTGSLATWAVPSVIKAHSLSIIIGSSMGAVFIFLVVCLGCLARSYIRQKWRDFWSCACCGPRCARKSAAEEAAAANASKKAAATPPPKVGCFSRICACIRCLFCCCCCRSSKAKAATAEKKPESESEEEEESSEESGSDEDDDGNEPAGSGVELETVYNKAAFTTSASAADFAKAGQASAGSSVRESVRKSVGVGKSSTNPLTSAPVSPSRRSVSKR